MITIEDFAKVEMRVGTVIEAGEIEGSDRLLKLKVDVGEEHPRQVLAGIKQWYKHSDLVDKQFVFVTNLEPRIMMGLESQAMILAADPSTHNARSGQAPIPIKPLKKTKAGSKIR